MLGEVFHINVAEIAQTGVQGDIGKVDSLDFHTLHQLAAEVKAGGRRRHGSLVARKDGLETFGVVRFYGTVDDAVGQRRFAQRIKSLLELIVRTVVKEAKRTPARSGVVDNLRHHGVVIAEVELIADTYLTGRVHQYIPQPELFVQLAQQKHFNARTGLLLISVEAGGENLGIVEDEHILVIKIVQNILEHLVLNLTRLAVQHQQTRLVPVLRGVQSYLLFGKLEFELRQFHKYIMC